MRLPAIASADGQPATPPPSSPVNLTDILVRGREYSTLLALLSATLLGTQLTYLINIDGFTLFAPTDDAFKNNLLPEQKVDLLLYHLLPHFYTLQDFTNITNPVMTLASGNASGGAGYTLDFTVNTGNDEVNISTSVVETQFDTDLYLQRPLAVFKVDKVLLPLAIFPAPNGPSNAGAGRMKYSEVVLGFMFACALLV